MRETTNARTHLAFQFYDIPQTVATYESGSEVNLEELERYRQLIGVETVPSTPGLTLQALATNSYVNFGPFRLVYSDNDKLRRKLAKIKVKMALKCLNCKGCNEPLKPLKENCLLSDCYRYFHYEY